MCLRSLRPRDSSSDSYRPLAVCWSWSAPLVVRPPWRPVASPPTNRPSTFEFTAETDPLAGSSRAEKASESMNERGRQLRVRDEMNEMSKTRLTT